jgi:hypothetical protein
MAVDACNLGQYALVKARRNGGAFAPISEDFYWLPDQELQPGHYVLIYTGLGQPRWTTLQGTGQPVYVLHLGSKRTLFNDPSIVPLLITVAEMSAPT